MLFQVERIASSQSGDCDTQEVRDMPLPKMDLQCGPTQVGMPVTAETTQGSLALGSRALCRTNSCCPESSGATLYTRGNTSDQFRISIHSMLTMGTGSAPLCSGFAVFQSAQFAALPKHTDHPFAGDDRGRDEGNNAEKIKNRAAI